MLFPLYLNKIPMVWIYDHNINFQLFQCGDQLRIIWEHDLFEINGSCHCCEPVIPESHVPNMCGTRGIREHALRNFCKKILKMVHFGRIWSYFSSFFFNILSVRRWDKTARRVAVDSRFEKSPDPYSSTEFRF